jgi:hypothetical protein
VTLIAKLKIDVMEILELLGATKETSNSVATEVGCVRMSSSQP